MGKIVERITGNSFQSELDRIINRPTGFHFKLIAKNAYNPDMSPYHELHGSSMVPEPHWTWIKGDGGITTTALELAHFPFEWSNGTIISDSSYHRMITSTLLNDGIETGYGLGVRKGTFEGHPVHGHTGGHKTTKSKMMFFPNQKLSIVVMVNTDNTPSNANKIFGEVALAVLDKKTPDHNSVNRDIEDPVRFEGTYQSPVVKGFGTVNITFNKKDSHLYYRYNDGGTKFEKMHHLGNGEFWIERWPLDRVQFDMAKDGQVHALREYYTGFYVNLRKKID
jgi:CubicO group peptidase (beta-lactamase class C family)